MRRADGRVEGPRAAFPARGELDKARISLDPPRTVGYRIGEYFVRRNFGEVLDPFRAMAHNLPVLQAISKLEQSVPKWNTLDPGLKDLADFAAAVKIGCPWCVDFGYWIMHTHGIPREKIEAVPHWRDSELFGPLERLVLEYAEAMTDTPPNVEDDLVKKLLDHLDEAQLVELTMIVCVENIRSRFNAAIGLPGQGFKDRCDLPQGTGSA